MNSHRGAEVRTKQQVVQNLRNLTGPHPAEVHDRIPVCTKHWKALFDISLLAETSLGISESVPIRLCNRTARSLVPEGSADGADGGQDDKLRVLKGFPRREIAEIPFLGPSWQLRESIETSNFISQCGHDFNALCLHRVKDSVAGLNI